MAKNKWGGYCPSHLSFNSARLSKNMCTVWQHHLYNAWYDHGKLGYIPKNDSWLNFANFYNWVQQQPLFPQFMQNHSAYQFDKDFTGVHMFTSSCVQLVPYQTNLSVMRLQNSATVIQSLNIGRAKKAMPILCVTPMGNVIQFPSMDLCVQCIGIRQGTISSCCRKLHGTNTVQQGKFKGWSFYYV